MNNFKNWMAWIIIAVMTISLSACGGTEPSKEVSSVHEQKEPVEARDLTHEIGKDWREDNVLNILAVGDDYLQDTFTYVAEISKAFDIENVKIGCLTVSNGTVSSHWENWSQNKTAYNYQTLGTGENENENGVSFEQVAKKESWDYILLSHGSDRTSGGGFLKAENFDKLPDLAKKAKKICQNAKIGWLISSVSWTGSDEQDFLDMNSDSMLQYTSTMDVIKDIVMGVDTFEVLVPVGSAIQNARTARDRDTITQEDGRHLTKYGSYVAGITVMSILSDIQLNNTLELDLEDWQKEIAVWAAMSCIENPFVVSTPGGF